MLGLELFIGRDMETGNEDTYLLPLAHGVHRRRMADRPAVRKVLAAEGATEPLWRKTVA